LNTVRSVPVALLAAALLGAPAAVASPQGDVAALGWLVGQWRETKGGVSVTETWTRGPDGALAGTGETARPGRPLHVERMTITAETAGATFTATLPGQAPTPFVARPGAPGETVFENKAHDFPQRIAYRRCGPDLCARIEGEIGGKLQSQAWRFAKVK